MTKERENNNDEPQTAAAGRTSLVSNVKPRHPMDTLLKNGGLGAFPKVGEIVDGIVLEKKGSRIFIDLGSKGVGIIYGREFYLAEELVKNLNPGDTVNAKVIDPDNEDGYVELSLKEAGEEKRWIDLEKMKEEGTILELPVEKANTGGLILSYSGIEGFLPASQLSAKNYPHVDGGDKGKIFQELQKFVGKTLKVKVLDLDARENKLIFTEKALDLEETRKALQKYKIGDVVEGEITGVVDFGAFMRFYPVRSQTPQASAVPSEAEQTSGGAGPVRSPLPEATTDMQADMTSGAANNGGVGLEGLIHLSEIDWTLVEDPRKVLKPGEKVRAKIVDIQNYKVSLSLKRLKEDPWLKVPEKYRKGAVINGKITRFNPFGAFAELGNEVQGLVHISEFGTETKMREELELGKEYEFKILLVDPKEHRISLGMIRKEEKS